MQTNLILHNSISLDGSLTNFAVDMELHYRIAGEANRWGASSHSC